MRFIDDLKYLVFLLLVTAGCSYLKPVTAIDTDKSKLRNPANAKLVKVTQEHRNIYTTMTSKPDELGACYKKGLAENPKLEGTVETKVVVLPNGEIESVDLKSSSLGHDDTDLCIVNVVKQLKFKPLASDKKVSVIVPYTFKR